MNTAQEAHEFFEQHPDIELTAARNAYYFRFARLGGANVYSDTVPFSVHENDPMRAFITAAELAKKMWYASDEPTITYTRETVWTPRQVGAQSGTRTNP